MSEQIPNDPAEADANNGADDRQTRSVITVINTVCVGAGGVYAATQSMTITLVTTVGAIALAGLGVIMSHRGRRS